MKKFAFLLAIVAVFAMSATAFAATGQVDVTAIGNVKADTAETGASNGAVVVSSDSTGNLYYIGKAAQETITAVVSADTETTTDTGTAGAASADITTVVGESSESTTKITFGTWASKAVPMTLTVTDASLDVLPSAIVVEKAGTLGISSPLDKTTGKTKLTLNTVNVATTVSADAFVERVDGANQTFKLGGDGYTLKAATAGTDIIVSKDIALPTGINAVVSGDTVIVSADKTAKVGKYVVEVRVDNATDVTVSEDKGHKGITVAGLADKDVVMKVAIEVKANPVDEIIAAISADKNRTEGVNLVLDGKVVPVSDEIVISEDHILNLAIVSLDATGKIPSVITAEQAAAVKIGQTATHSATTQPHASPSVSKVDGDYTLVVSVTPTDVANLKKMVANSNVSTAAVVVEDYDFHLDALGKEYGLVYQTATEVADSSSSGACSMGFGLAAIAGLAALALRKRSK